MKKLFVAVLAIAGLVACNNENVVREQNHSQAIDFGVSVDNATRSNDPSTTINTIEDFSVWAYMNQVDGYVFNNELVSRSGGAWTYVHTQYWLPGNEYYFAAFAGKRNDDGTFADVAGIPNAMAADGLGQITFTNEDGTNDILYAEDYVKVETTPAQVDKVNLNFAHLLSKVKFSFINGFVNHNNTIIVKDIKMVAPMTATVDLTADPIAWNYDVNDNTNAVVLDFGHMYGGNKLGDGKSAASDKELLTIPAPATQEYTITFNVTLYNGERVGIDARPMTVKLKGLEFEAGRAYNLVATINQENLDLNAIEFEVEVDEWDEAANVDYGYDVATNSVHVQNPEGLLAAAEAIANETIPSDATIVLEQDIDLSTFTRGVVSNWTPIGTSKENPFTGTFDGNGHKIKNFSYVVTGDDEAWYVGLFGYANNATIKNLVMENVTITSEKAYFAEVGAVVGHLEGTSTLENITITGDVKIEGNVNNVEASRIGAVVGGNNYGTITVKNVRVNANAGSYVKGGSHVGGIAGQLQFTNIFENCSTNIDVTAGRFFAGGIIGCAGQADVYTKCYSTGNIAVVAGRANNDNDIHRVGGIAGGWNDGETKVCTLVDCSYTGQISGKDVNDNVAETFDCRGLVGRGYGAKAGAQVVVDSDVYTYAGNGVYTINGLTQVSTADELIAALEAKEGVYFLNDIKIEPASMSNAYGATGINVKNGQTIDGNGYTLNIKGAGGTWDSGINTTGGLIKNLTVTGSFRGIFINHTSTYSEKVVLENVTLKDVVYTISCDQGLYQTIEATNCSFYGWTSFAKTAGEAKFVDCYFGAGNGYKYCRPYSNTEFVGCTFCPGYAVDTTRATVTFTDCTWEE